MTNKILNGLIVILGCLVAWIILYFAFTMGRINGEAYIDRRAVIEGKVCQAVFISDQNKNLFPWKITADPGFTLYSCRDVK